MKKTLLSEGAVLQPGDIAKEEAQLFFDRFPTSLSHGLLADLGDKSLDPISLVIRRNWHLLPYDQLLTLLGWSAEQLAFTLREDDYLFIKLGSLKPQCEPLRWTPPTKAEQARAAAIARIVREEFGAQALAGDDPLFSFVDRLNELRARPVEFFVSRPELKGVEEGDYATLCTSTSAVRQYVTDAIESLCQAVPGIGGVFTISASENRTDCWSHHRGQNPSRQHLGTGFGTLHSGSRTGLAARSGFARRGVEGLMLGRTLGGHPSPNLEAAIARLEGVSLKPLLLRAPRSGGERDQLSLALGGWHHRVSGEVASSSADLHTGP